MPKDKPSEKIETKNIPLLSFDSFKFKTQNKKGIETFKSVFLSIASCNIPASVLIDRRLSVIFTLVTILRKRIMVTSCCYSVLYILYIRFIYLEVIP